MVICGIWCSIGKKLGWSFHLNHSFSNLDGWQVRITLAELGIIEWIGKEIGVSRKNLFDLGHFS